TGRSRPSAPLRYARLAISVACASPLASERLVPAVPRESPDQLHAPYTPVAACPVIRRLAGSSISLRKPRGFRRRGSRPAENKHEVIGGQGQPPRQDDAMLVGGFFNIPDILQAPFRSIRRAQLLVECFIGWRRVFSVP